MPTGERCTWGLFGKEDELGTLNFLSVDSIVKAAGLVKKGRVFNLDLPLDQPSPSLTDMREPYEHHVESDRVARDDHLDNFHLQCSSQWDGLAHVRYREFGFYQGLNDQQLDGGHLGIDVLARRGIIGRGLLIDVAAHLESSPDYSPADEYPITPELLNGVLAAQGVAVQEGDIILLRTGWVGWYLSLSQPERDRLRGSLGGRGTTLRSPGLHGAVETAEWLWDRRVAAVGADNPAVEVLPVQGKDFLHRRLIPLLGMPIGELWDLEELGRDCREDQVYECFFVSSPLNLPAGVGSPANAYAIK